MRFIVFLILIPLTAVAQQPGGQMDQQQYFEQMKQMMLPMIEKSIPVMEEARRCVESSGNSDQLNKCVTMMADFQKEMMAMMGAPAQGQKGAPPEPEVPQLEWSESLQAEIIRDLGESLKGTLTTRKCLTSSASPKAMEACMSQAGMGARK